jgi:hypothetical protein
MLAPDFASYVDKNLQSAATREELIEAVSAEVARKGAPIQGGGYGPPPQADAATRKYVALLNRLLPVLAQGSRPEGERHEIAEVKWAVRRLVDRGQLPEEFLSKL